MSNQRLFQMNPVENKNKLETRVQAVAQDNTSMTIYLDHHIIYISRVFKHIVLSASVHAPHFGLEAALPGTSCHAMAWRHDITGSPRYSGEAIMS